MICLGEVAALKQFEQSKREEIARLKGLKGRPTIRPGGSMKGTELTKRGRQEKWPGRVQGDTSSSAMDEN